MSQIYKIDDFITPDVVQMLTVYLIGDILTCKLVVQMSKLMSIMLIWSEPDTVNLHMNIQRLQTL